MRGEPTGGAALAAAAATDIGQRSQNEDAWLLDNELGLMLVADGVGGQQAGEVASALACEVIAREVAGGASLEQSIRSANREVIAAVKQGKGRAGMATTVVGARFTGANYELAWVGDSRAYLWDGRLKLLSRDHSRVQDLFARGQLSVERTRSHPEGNIILQAIGMQSEADLQVGTNRGRLAAGELLLLCSDGLWDVVDSAGLAEILRGGDKLQVRVQALVEAAVHGGGQDNITAILMAVKPGTEAVPGRQDDVCWTFDPESGTYSGLPERAAIVPIISPAGGPVVPRGGDLTRIRASQGARATAAATPGDRGNRGVGRARAGRIALWVLLAAVTLWVLVFGLGL